MKIDCQLDYQTILRNQAQPVHVVVKLTADRLERQQRKRSPFVSFSTGAVPWRQTVGSCPESL